jgi:predicted Ser/Thr protein kinase
MSVLDRSSVTAATEHAMAVGREAVSSGLTDSDTVRRLYTEYTEFLRKGARGTFTQLLRSRQVIDEAGLQILEERVPIPKAKVDGRASGKFTLPTPGSSEAAERSLTTSAEDALSLAKRTVGFGTVMAADLEDDPPMVGMGTVDDDDVLDLPGFAERTMEDMAALPLPGQAPPRPAPIRPPVGLTVEVPAPSEQDLDDPPAMAERTMEVDAPSGALAGPPPPESDVVREPRVGEVLGDYELTEVLGRGGMGVIYKVTKKGSGEVYALKTLLMASAANLDRERFLQEVEALRRLDHDGIVRVHGSGRTGEIDWYVMDYIKGKELKELMADGSLRPNDRLRIFEEICKAMEHAHERGIVHRDLKPANVVIDEEGKVIVLDFGVAKLTTEDQSLTRTGAMLGTPYYMAPEQVINPKGVDHRADVYALGAMLYEMMTGQVPFPGETFGEVADKIMHEHAIPPSKVEPKLHVDIDKIILKALARELEERHPDITALRLEVARYRRGRRQGVSPLDPIKDAWKRFSAKHRTGMIIGFILASLLYLPIILFT